MPTPDKNFIKEMEQYLETSSSEIPRYAIFHDGFNLFTDNPVELRAKLVEIAKASTRLFGISREYKKLLFQVKRFQSLAEETLMSARVRALSELTERERKGLAKEERQFVADSKLEDGEVENHKFWCDGVLLCEDYVRMVDQRIKELEFAQKNVLGQISALNQERRLHGVADNPGWSH